MVKKCGVNTAKFLNYVCPLCFIIIHDGVKCRSTDACGKLVRLQEVLTFLRNV